jgi:hypothetical protein
MPVVQMPRPSSRVSTYRQESCTLLIGKMDPQ